MRFTPTLWQACRTSQTIGCDHTAVILMMQLYNCQISVFSAHLASCLTEVCLLLSCLLFYLLTFIPSLYLTGTKYIVVHLDVPN
jgi:hypothetical protein